MNKDIRINNGILQIDMDDLKLDERYATLDHVYDIEYRMISDKNSIKDIYTKSEVEGRIWDEVQNLRDEWKTSINNTTYQTLETRVFQLENLLASYKTNIDELERALQELQPKEENPFYTIIEKVFN